MIIVIQQIVIAIAGIRIPSCARSHSFTIDVFPLWYSIEILHQYYHSLHILILSHAVYFYRLQIPCHVVTSPHVYYTNSYISNLILKEIKIVPHFLQISFHIVFIEKCFLKSKYYVVGPKIKISLHKV